MTSQVMKPGHAFTIEPMVNAGGNHRDALWPDGAPSRIEPVPLTVTLP
jgi:methionine aminopeptidase